MSQENESPDLEILGQKFRLPDTNLKLIAFIVFMICATVLLYHVIKDYNITQTEDGISFTKITIQDGKVTSNKGFIIGFWTPCNDTEQGMYLETHEDSMKYLWQVNSWQLSQGKASIDSQNRDFAKVIMAKLDFKGYRRYKVVGEGNTGLKPGWWWNIGFDGDCNDEFFTDFKDAYMNFWCPEAEGKDWDKLYMEVIGNPDKLNKDKENK